MGGHGSGGHPMPTALKVLRGKGKVNRREPQPVGDLREPPAHFDAEMRDAWSYAIEHAPPGLLKRLDSSVLETWVTAHVLYRRALAAINQHGMTATTPSGYEVQSAHVAILNKQAMILLKTIDHLGFSPASRSRVVDAADNCGDWAEVATG